jgi:hypothetical protein
MRGPLEHHPHTAATGSRNSSPQRVKQPHKIDLQLTTLGKAALFYYWFTKMQTGRAYTHTYTPQLITGLALSLPTADTEMETQQRIAPWDRYVR